MDPQQCRFPMGWALAVWKVSTEPLSHLRSSRAQQISSGLLLEAAPGDPTMLDSESIFHDATVRGAFYHLYERFLYFSSSTVYGR
jgi:hypothetical protein